MIVVVGLGNIGSEYNNTYHNMGFSVLNRFAEKNGFVFYVQLRLTAKVEDGFGITDLRPTDRKNYLPQAVKLAAERDLTAWTNVALSTAAEANCDFFGMKERLYRRYPKDYAAVGEGLLKNITYRVTVTVSPLR